MVLTLGLDHLHPPTTLTTDAPSGHACLCLMPQSGFSTPEIEKEQTPLNSKFNRVTYLPIQSFPYYFPEFLVFFSLSYSTD